MEWPAAIKIINVTPTTITLDENHELAGEEPDICHQVSFDQTEITSNSDFFLHWHITQKLHGGTDVWSRIHSLLLSTIT
jgi:FKBP-type peptidyl-prolyl cis-trans isomerase 2